MPHSVRSLSHAHEVGVNLVVTSSSIRALKSGSRSRCRERRVGEAVARKLPSVPATWNKCSSYATVCSGQHNHCHYSSSWLTMPLTALLLGLNSRQPHSPAVAAVSYMQGTHKACNARIPVHTGQQVASAAVGMHTCRLVRPARPSAKLRPLTVSDERKRRRSSLQPQDVSASTCASSGSIHQPHLRTPQPQCSHLVNSTLRAGHLKLRGTMAMLPEQG